MACALYAWNCKRRLKTTLNKRTIPITPIELEPLESLNQATPYLHWTKKCNNKTIDLIGLLWKINLPAGNLYEQESKLNVMELNLTPQHKDNLLRNLTGFNLQLDPINKDGNCFFRATARQLKKHLQRSDLQNLQHISSLGIGINEERDTENLRLLFVREVTENLDEYREWMSCSSNVREIERFKTDGHFASDIGDICTKACANLLRVPIIVITALPNVPSIPFLPKHFITAVPTYLAYDHSGPGHYDATKEFLNSNDETEGNDTKTRCTCGKNVKDPSKMACTSSKRKCRCFNCKNKNNAAFEGERQLGETRKRKRGCTCGNTLNKEDKGRVSCRDGKRKTKCPCVAEGLGCTESCKCYNCGNIFQIGGVSASPGTGRKRRRATISTYKRQRGKEFMERQKAPVTSGP
ncbi:unnamed protein product [Porites lobata]|uniref:OTU domain-containing protein n=1 Tax=Porites lobata TaxID=104759 RepID=A0ABN8QMH1_9CNID|nr:unnamed protein product [Porites lobata]